MKKVTLVFFEFPAAMAEINFWEQSMKEKIERKEIVAEDRFSFYMKSGEVLECYNNNQFSFDDVCSQFKIEQQISYKKTLLFGKFNVQQLEKIMRVMLSVEKYAEQ